MWRCQPSLCFALAALAVVRYTAGDDPTWSYQAVMDWTKLPGSTCAKEQQSPIEIISLHAKADPTDMLESLQYTVGPVCNTAVLQSDGSTWVVKFDDDFIMRTTHLTFQQIKYFLKEVRFHAPSEHSIDGMFFDMEAQVVHQDWDGNQLIIAVFLQVGNHENHFLKRIIPHMPSDVSEFKYTSPWSLNPYRTLMPPLGSRHYYTFHGSLTTPPCTTGVQWIVLETPISVSMEQRTAYREALSNVNNTRCIVGAEPPIGVTLPWPKMLASNSRPIQAYGADHQLYHWPAPWLIGTDPKEPTVADALQEIINEVGNGRGKVANSHRTWPSTPYVLAALGSAIVLGFSVGRRLKRTCPRTPQDESLSESLE